MSENGILPSEELLIIMKPTLLEITISSGRPRFYARFPRRHASDWWANGSSLDMVMFMPNRNIMVIGMGIWELYHDDNGDVMKFKIEWKLKDNGDNIISEF